METRLSMKWARTNVVLISIFYIITGTWEYLVGFTQAESIPQGNYFLLDIYRSYAVNLGRITILVGLGILLFRFKFVRLLALVLAWWNLLTSPVIEIWWNIYAISIKKLLVTDSMLSLWAYSTASILILTFIRGYIIHILKVSKAGYIFLKEKNRD